MTPTEEKTVESKVDELIDIAGRVKHALNIRTVFIGVLGLILVLMSWVIVAQQDKLTDIAKVNKVNAKIGADNSELIKNATGPEAQARNAKSTIDILRRNAIETDCRSRRQQMRLPAPDPSIPCDQQTDASVFPGVAGLPTRG